MIISMLNRQAMSALMHAIDVQAGRLVLTEMPILQLGDNQILIKVAAAGVNHADILQRQGKYSPPAGASHILGLEVSGEIIALGANVEDWQIGDLVCALLSGSGYAEYAVAVAEASLCLPIPQNIDILAAASLPEAAFTTYANLVETAGAKAGNWVLIQGGSSGIGSFAIQLLKALGAQVITTVGNAEKMAFCQALGADVIINYKETDFAAAAMTATNGRGVDIILDIIGQDYFAQHLQILAPQGRLVTIATPSGKHASLDLLQILQKRLVITGSTLRSRNLAEKTALAQAVRHIVWPLIEAGQIKPTISQVFPLVEAVKAHAFMESSRHLGKIILSTPPMI